MASEVTRLRPRRRRVIRWVAAVVAAGGLCAAFPPVRIVRATKPTGHLAAKEFWEQRLLKSFDKAVDANDLIAEIRRDPKAAFDKHGRRVGIGGGDYYLLPRGGGGGGGGAHAPRPPGWGGGANP